MKVYKAVKKFFVNELDSYIAENALIYVYSKEIKLVISKLEDSNLFFKEDVEVLGEKNIVWIYPLLPQGDTVNLLEFVEELEELEENALLPQEMTIQERDSLNLNESQAFQISIFNKTLGREEHWDGCHWIGDGDVIVNNPNEIEIGIPVKANQLSTIDGVERLAISNITNSTQRQSMIGVVSSYDDKSKTSCVTTQGCCFVKISEAITEGIPLKASFGGDFGTRATTDRRFKYAVSLESSSEIGKLILAKLGNM